MLEGEYSQQTEGEDPSKEKRTSLWVQALATHIFAPSDNLSSTDHEIIKNVEAVKEHLDKVLGPARTPDFVTKNVVNPTELKSSELRAVKFFMSKGWTANQASGIVANLVRESSLDSNSVGDHGQAYGLAQWHSDRQENFRKWCGTDIRHSTFEQQLGFFHYELTEGQEQATGHLLRQTVSAEDAGAAVVHAERPANMGLNMAQRGNLAEKIAAAVNGVGKTMSDSMGGFYSAYNKNVGKLKSFGNVSSDGDTKIAAATPAPHSTNTGPNSAMPTVGGGSEWIRQHTT